MASTFRSIPGLKQTTGAETIDDRLAKLELRLQDGFSRIGEAMDHGISVENWEQHWIELLRQYESLYDEVAEAA